MTNQEAIKILDNLKPGDYSNPYEKGEAIVMAISALQAQENLQPTCNLLALDTISRQAAKLKVARVTWEDGDTHYDFTDKCVDCLDDVPSAQPAPQWIPCSERLPKKSGQYYVSGGDKVWICEFLILPNFTGGWCNAVSNPVVQAWMPLSEPYRAERRTDE